MIGYLQTRVRKQPIIALYFEFEFETVLKFYNLVASTSSPAEYVSMGLCLCDKYQKAYGLTHFIGHYQNVSKLSKE